MTDPTVAPEPPRESEALDPFRRSWRRHLAALALELLVVFVGVLAAFELSAWQERRSRLEKGQQLRVALRAEVAGVTRRAARAADGLPRRLAILDSLVQAGARPALTPHLEPLRVHSSVWEAVRNTGGLELLPVPLYLELSDFYNELSNGFEQIAQLQRLSEQELIPLLDRGPAAFYGEDGALRPRFRWYFDLQRGLADQSRGLARQGARLDSLLASARP